MAHGIQIRLTSTGVSRSNILIDDIREDNAGGRRGLPSEYVYLPAPTVAVPFPQITLTFGGLVPMSFERGDIRGYINRGLITIQFLVGGLLQGAMDGPVVLVAPPGGVTRTATVDENLFLVDSTLGAVTINLVPGTSALRSLFRVVDVGGAALVNPITVVAAPGDTIQGGASYVFPAGYIGAGFIWDQDSNWFLPFVGAALPGGPAGGGLAGLYPNPTVVPTPGLDTTADRLKGQTFTVAKSGGEFMTIEDGLAAAGAVAGINNRVTVLVSPGNYTENNPLTLPAYTSLICVGLQEVTQMTCANNGPGQHGIVLTKNSDIHGLQVIGASGVGAAGFCFSAACVECEIHDSKIQDCDIGWLSLAALPSPAIAVRSASVYTGTCTSVFKCAAGGLMNVEGALVLAFATITNLYHSTGVNSTLRVSSARNNGALTTRGAYVENSGNMQLYSIYFNNPAIAVEIPLSGGTLECLGSSLFATANAIILADTPTAICGLRACSANSATFNIGATAQLTGVFTDTNPLTPGFTVLGELWSGASATTRVPMASYSRATYLTGLTSGGGTSLPGGLNIDVAAGVGFVNTGTGVLKVTWGATTVAATANSDFYIYVTSAGTVTIATAAASLTTNISLAAGRAGPADVKFISRDVVILEQAHLRTHEWIQGNAGLLWESGLTVTVFAGLQLTIGSGSFWSPDELLTATGAAPATLLRWYRDPVVGWKFTTGDVDDGFYDDGSGVLAAIPGPTPWKKDGLYITKNGASEVYHYVYSQVTYADQAAAELGSLPIPPILFQQGDFAMPLAGLVVTSGGGTVTVITDERPVLGTAGAGSGAPAADHNALLNLGDDTHPQYVLLAGNAARNPFTGVLDANNGGLILPTSAAPAQVAEGSIVWNSVADVLTVGTGASRRTLVNTTGIQTLASKVLSGSSVLDQMIFTSVAAPAWAEGQVYYDQVDKALTVDVAGGSSLSIGQEMYIRAHNATGVVIPDGSVVVLSGATSGRPTIALGDASQPSSRNTLGVATQNIADGTEGFVLTYGLIHGVDGSGGAEAWANGDRLYLSATTPGALTKIPPPSPNHLVTLGWVLDNNAVTGILFIALVEGTDLPDLDDVSFPIALADGQLLRYVAANSRWENASKGVATAPSIVEAVATPYAVTITDGYVLVNPVVPVAFVVNLPAGATHETGVVIIKDKTGAASLNHITINANGAETIDGAASTTIDGNYASLTLVFSGTEWSLT